MMQLNIDSLTFVSILAQIEAAYDIEFEEDDIINLLDCETLGDLTDLIVEISENDSLASLPDLEPKPGS